MPELPEVEITRRGIEPFLADQILTGAIVRHRGLRWPVQRALAAALRGQRVRAVRRRGKYLIVECERGSLILHLGMSGSLRVLAASDPRAHTTISTFASAKRSCDCATRGGSEP